MGAARCAVKALGQALPFHEQAAAERLVTPGHLMERHPRCHEPCGSAPLRGWGGALPAHADPQGQRDMRLRQVGRAWLL